jgi:hypothetical protein
MLCCGIRRWWDADRPWLIRHPSTIDRMISSLDRYIPEDQSAPKLAKKRDFTVVDRAKKSKSRLIWAVDL